MTSIDSFSFPDENDSKSDIIRAIINEITYKINLQNLKPIALKVARASKYIFRPLRGTRRHAERPAKSATRFEVSGWHLIVPQEVPNCSSVHTYSAKI